MPETRRRFDPDFKEDRSGSSERQVSRSPRWPGISGSTMAPWVTGWPRTAPSGVRARGYRPTSGAVCGSSSGKSPSCEWSAMSSSDPWSCGSRRRRHDRGIVCRRPEDRPWCSPRHLRPGLGVSESWFYKWRGRPPSPRQVRRAELDANVKAIFDASGGTCGSPRVLDELRDAGERVSKTTVEASMGWPGVGGPARSAPAALADPPGHRRGPVPRSDRPGLQRGGDQPELVGGSDRAPHLTMPRRAPRDRPATRATARPK